MNNNFFYVIIIIMLISCNSRNNFITNNENDKISNIKNNQENMSNHQTRFSLISNKFASGTSHFKTRKMKSYYDVSEFLSKLWYIFGKPNAINYEGYTYTIKDTQSNVIFTAYCAGGGLGYVGNTEDFDKLEKVINDFELLLSNTPLADCEIEVENDFGVFKYGAKDGKPFIEQ